MTAEAKRLRDNLSFTAKAHADAKQAVADLERTCSHDFTIEHERVQTQKEGYYTSMMGHFTQDKDGNILGPKYWRNAQYEDRYTRTCKLCGKTDTTNKLKPKETVSTVPDFS